MAYKNLIPVNQKLIACLDIGVENSGASNYVTIFKDGKENKVLISHSQPKK